MQPADVDCAFYLINHLKLESLLLLVISRLIIDVNAINVVISTIRISQSYYATVLLFSCDL